MHYLYKMSAQDCTVALNNSAGQVAPILTSMQQLCSLEIRNSANQYFLGIWLYKNKYSTIKKENKRMFVDTKLTSAEGFTSCFVQNGT